MNELLTTLLSSAGLSGVDSITGLLGNLMTGTTVAEATTASTCGSCNTGCRRSCNRNRCCTKSCCNRNCCATTLPAAVASATDEVTYDLSVSRYVDVPMRIVNLCPGKPSSCGGWGCCCWGIGSGGCNIPGCWAR